LQDGVNSFMLTNSPPLKCFHH